jgi:glycosyltransferase involved in cell wall biosynthesis
MLGEPEDETPAVRATAELLLGPEGFAMRTVPREQVDDYYRAADVFALASLKEAFGLAYVEAMAQGLPCVAHDQAVTRFVLGEEGLLTDLRERGALTAAIRSALSLGDSGELRARRHHAVRERFGWPALRPAYVAMLAECAVAPAPAPARAVRLEVTAGVGG